MACLRCYDFQLMKRNPTRPVKVGSITLGGGHPVAVQSMCATHTQDVDATVGQIEALHAAGADVVRVAVDSKKDAQALAEIRQRTEANLSVDLQENYRLAELVAPHVDKIRYNPGHLYHHEREKPWQEKVKYLAGVAAENDCAIRVGSGLRDGPCRVRAHAHSVPRRGRDRGRSCGCIRARHRRASRPSSHGDAAGRHICAIDRTRCRTRRDDGRAHAVRHAGAARSIRRLRDCRAWRRVTVITPRGSGHRGGPVGKITGGAQGSSPVGARNGPPIT